MGRIQGEHHVRSHRLLGTRRRYPHRRGNARRRRSVDRHLEVLESQYGLRCPTPLAAPALRRASRLALRAPSAPALRTCLLARLPSPSGLVSAATTCPRPAEVVGRGTWYREATAVVAASALPDGADLLRNGERCSRQARWRMSRDSTVG